MDPRNWVGSTPRHGGVLALLRTLADVSTLRASGCICLRRPDGMATSYLQPMIRLVLRVPRLYRDPAPLLTSILAVPLLYQLTSCWSAVSSIGIPRLPTRIPSTVARRLSTAAAAQPSLPSSGTAPYSFRTHTLTSSTSRPSTVARRAGFVASLRLRAISAHPRPLPHREATGRGAEFRCCYN